MSPAQPCSSSDTTPMSTRAAFRKVNTRRSVWRTNARSASTRRRSGWPGGAPTTRPSHAGSMSARQRAAGSECREREASRRATDCSRTTEIGGSDITNTAQVCVGLAALRGSPDGNDDGRGHGRRCARATWPHLEVFRARPRRAWPGRSPWEHLSKECDVLPLRSGAAGPCGKRAKGGANPRGRRRGVFRDDSGNWFSLTGSRARCRAP